jgi:hypothetical protein
MQSTATANGPMSRHIAVSPTTKANTIDKPASHGLVADLGRTTVTINDHPAHADW